MYVIKVEKSWSAGNNSGYVIRFGERDDEDAEYYADEWCKTKCGGGHGNGYDWDWSYVDDPEEILLALTQSKESLRKKRIAIEEEIENEVYEMKKLLNDLPRGQVDLRTCEKDDILISALGTSLKYIRPSEETGYYDHEVEYIDGEFKGSSGTRTHDGYVFRKNRIPETDHDIVAIIKKK